MDKFNILGVCIFNKFNLLISIFYKYFYMYFYYKIIRWWLSLSLASFFICTEVDRVAEVQIKVKKLRGKKKIHI